MTPMSRRGFLGLLGTAGAGAAVGFPLLSGLGGSSSTGLLLRSQRALPQPFTMPLTVPPVLRPVRSDASADYYEIVQREGTVEMLPGVRTTVWGYNGIFPGPTIESRSGRRTVVRHLNELPVPVVVHLHGGHTPPTSDGYPTDLILPTGTGPGQTRSMVDDPQASVTTGQRTYTYPLQQRAAILWYHDHRMDYTGASIWRGLAGFHLIRDPEEDALPLPRGDRELPLMITDRAFTADGSLRYPSIDPSLATTPGVTTGYTAGVLGDVILVNGRPWPLAHVDGARYRMRVLNASNARRYRLALDPPPPGGGGLVQIGSDGGLLEHPISHDAIDIAPAERFDVIVDFARYPVGQHVTLVNQFGTGPTAAVMRFQVARAATDDTHIPDRLSTIAALDPTAATVTRTMLFQDHGQTMGWTINGAPFSPGHVNAAPRLGAVEVWRLISDFHHPIHLHLVHFQVLSRGLNGPGPYDHGWKDVLDLRPAEEAAIITRFDGDPGRYVFHCHNLEHEDMAMMGNFTLT